MTARAAKTSLEKSIHAFSIFINVIPFHSISQMLRNFFRTFNSKGLFLISEKEKENCCLVFASYVKRETRRFLRSIRATTAKNCTKTWIILSLQKSVMHEQSCCFADLNIVFPPFSLVSPSLDYFRLI